MGEAIPQSSDKELLLWFLRRRRCFQVHNNSMLPHLQPGENILVNLKAYVKTQPRLGDVVLAQHPHKFDLLIVKRVAAIHEDGSCFLQGDNLAFSEDSRSFGFVLPEQILGQVTSRFL